jgi:peroxiredoxin family protein
MGDMIAVILASGAPDRLYTGLSLLVSTAAEDEPARGLVTFEALAPMLDDGLEARSAAERGELFARTLAELRATARELPDCLLWACAAAVETTGADRDAIAARLDGVRSTPRFLAETAGARLVVV